MGVFEHKMRLIGIFSSRFRLFALPCVSFRLSVKCSIYLLLQFKYSHFSRNSGTIQKVIFIISGTPPFQMFSSCQEFA